MKSTCIPLFFLLLIIASIAIATFIITPVVWLTIYLLLREFPYSLWQIYCVIFFVLTIPAASVIMGNYLTSTIRILLTARRLRLSFQDIAFAFFVLELNRTKHPASWERSWVVEALLTNRFDKSLAAEFIRSGIRLHQLKRSVKKWTHAPRKGRFALSANCSSHCNNFIYTVQCF